jgi:hypothetical protein
MNIKKISYIAAAILIAVCCYSRLGRAQDNTNSISLLAGYVSVDGDWKMFQQNLWMQRDFTGGLENLTIDRNMGDGKQLHVEGRALSDYDYNFLMNLKKKDFGYMNVSFDSFRTYYDDSSLFYIFPRPASVPSFFELNRDLHADRTDFSLDFGLTLPDQPKYTLGYERMTRIGQITLGGGLSRDSGADLVFNNTGDDAQFVYPNTKLIEWQVNTLKAGAEFEVKGATVGLNQKFAFYSANNYADNIWELRNNTLPAYETYTLTEEPSYRTSTTTLLADKQVNENVFMKGGYLLNLMNGKDKWERDWYNNGTLAARYFDGEVDTEAKSNVFSWGMNFKPMKSLQLTTRLRYENTDTNAFSRYLRDGVSFLVPPLYNGVLDLVQDANTDMNKSSFGESVGLQYSLPVVPRTTFFANADLEQTSYKYLVTTGGVTGTAAPLAMQEDYKYDIDRSAYTVGINTRPIRPVYITGQYRRINNTNDYVVYTDNHAGYPLWMGDHSRVSDEFSVRTDLRPVKWGFFTVKFSAPQTAYDLSKYAMEPDTIAAAHLQTTSCGVTLTPMAKLYINTMYSWQTSRLKTDASGASALAQGFYDGNSDSIVTTANYELSEKTSLTSQYERWSAVDTKASQQGMGVGVERRITPNLRANVNYTYYVYDDKSQGGNNDYKANVIFATLTAKF